MDGPELLGAPSYAAIPMTIDDPDEIAARVAAARRELGMDDPRRPQLNKAAITALLLGLVALGCLGFLTGIPAIVVGVLGLRRATVAGGDGKAMSIIGIVTGAIGTVWSVAYVLSLTK